MWHPSGAGGGGVILAPHDCATVLVIQVRADEGLHANTGGENGLEVMYSGNICREDHWHLLDSSYPALRPKMSPNKVSL